MKIGHFGAAMIALGAVCVPAAAQQTKAPALTAATENLSALLPRARPEDVGMSSERLAAIATLLNADIAHGRLPGAVVAIVRRGKLVYFEAFGYRDKAAGVPMTTDTIFNIASMTKPATAVGALMLYEQGRLLIDDPLAKYFPKFADMRVAILDQSGETIVDKGRRRNRSPSRTRCAIPPGSFTAGAAQPPYISSTPPGAARPPSK